MKTREDFIEFMAEKYAKVVFGSSVDKTAPFFAALKQQAEVYFDALVAAGYPPMPLEAVEGMADAVTVEDVFYFDSLTVWRDMAGYWVRNLHSE